MSRFTNKVILAAISGILIVSLFLGIFCGYDAVIRYLTGGIWAI